MKEDELAITIVRVEAFPSGDGVCAERRQGGRSQDERHDVPPLANGDELTWAAKTLGRNFGGGYHE